MRKFSHHLAQKLSTTVLPVAEQQNHSVASADTLNDFQNKIIKFSNALKKGVEFVYNNTSQTIANSLYGSFPSTDIETITKVVDRYKEIDAWTSDLKFSKQGYEKLLDVLKSSNELSNYVDYEILVTNKYVQ